MRYSERRNTQSAGDTECDGGGNCEENYKIIDID